MTTQRAIELLTTLRHTCENAGGATGEALDMAIEMMQRSIVKTDIESIIKGVVRETRVTEEEMVRKGRQREFVEARAIVCWLSYHYTRMTLTSIGNRLGRDHASMIYYNRLVDSWLEEPRLNLRASRIITRIINELEHDDTTCDGSTHRVQQVAQA